MKGHAVEVFLMTPERKDRMARAAKKLFLMLNTELPDISEQFAVLDLLRTGMEKAYGVTCHGTGFIDKIGES